MRAVFALLTIVVWVFASPAPAKAAQPDGPRVLVIATGSPGGT